MGEVVADNGTTYTTLTAWEATVGTTGGPGGTCTVSGSFDDGGIILNYADNSLDDPSATFNYVIKGVGGAIFSPLIKSAFGIIQIITDTTIMDVEFSGLAARDEGGAQDFVVGVDINLGGDKENPENAALYRVKVEGIGSAGGEDAYGIRCNDQLYNTITMQRCYVTDVSMSGGFSSYGIGIKEGSSNKPDRTNKPTISVNLCTVDSIGSHNSSSATPNESIGIYMSDASGYDVTSCVSHKITGSVSYGGGSSTSFCYGPSTSNNQRTWYRGNRSGSQSSDKTAHYAGTHKAINPFTGAPGRPDPAIEFNCSDEIHPLKIARNGVALTADLSINYVYHGSGAGNRNTALSSSSAGTKGSIGAFGYFVEVDVGTGANPQQSEYRAYSTITTALLGISENPKQNEESLTDTGPLRAGEGYLLGYVGDAGSHTDGETYLIVLINADGVYDEQVNCRSALGNSTRTIGGLLSDTIPPVVLTPTHQFAAIIFQGTDTANRPKIQPLADGYGTDLFNAEGEIVQNLEIDGGYGRFGTGLTAVNVHNCIVHGAGFESGDTIIESIQTGIEAGLLVTSSLVYGEVKNGIISRGAYNNTVVLNNMSLTGVGITVDGDLQCKNNLVLTSGTHISVAQGAYSGDGVGIGSGNLVDTPLQFNQYFRGPSWSSQGLREGDSPSSQYALKANSFAINSGVVPTYADDYKIWDSVQIWPFVRVYTSGQEHIDGNHWFKDGSTDSMISSFPTYAGAWGLGLTDDNRFRVSVSHSGFDSGWDERFGERTEPQPPFIAFMDF